MTDPRLHTALAYLADELLPDVRRSNDLVALNRIAELFHEAANVARQRAAERRAELGLARQQPTQPRGSETAAWAVPEDAWITVSELARLSKLSVDHWYSVLADDARLSKQLGARRIGAGRNWRLSRTRVALYLGGE